MSAPRPGAHLTEDGVMFALWAPAARSVDVVLDKPHAMSRDDKGWFTLHTTAARAGTFYRFRIDGELDVPDPASQFQPQDIAGPSEVIDHGAYRWRAETWRCRPWNEAVFLEAHVGTFTPQGSYRAMIDKLDHLVATGITALELMPLADFPGQRNWGYDGVLWYAPDSAYGRPEDLKALIDEAHLRGLMVFLDVVYNHFGPEGNYLSRYAPGFFSKTQTPWGNAIDYRVAEVRRFAIENAIHWLKDYRFDGLRLDAVHAIVEPGEPHFLNELSKTVGLLAKEAGRHVHLVLENDDNRADLLDPTPTEPAGQFRAQWNDDYHHAWHGLLTGETDGYYSDYTEQRSMIARALGSGFAYQGEASPHRNGALRGQPSGALPTPAFVNFLQNHDQIGNRALGERLEVLAKPEAIEAALAVTLLAPMIPLLFMGEEWGATSPFPFFCDFRGELAEAVRQGRRREFKSAYERHDIVPDPLEPSTFSSARLDWHEIASAKAHKRLTLVRDLLTIRREEIIPRLSSCRFQRAEAQDDQIISARWSMADVGLTLIANLSDQPAPLQSLPGRRIWTSGVGSDLSPWAVAWSMEAR